MAVTIIKNASVTINSVDLSSLVESVQITHAAEKVEVTAMGMTSRRYATGLVADSMVINFYVDFAVTPSAKTEATIYPLVGTTTTVVVKPDSGATSTTNPTYTYSNAFVESHTPIGNGKVGEIPMTQITLSGGDIVKTTS
ncbi:hypothetical protein UFOVP226_17 [uncultured Caudovirales phage]|uniref:Uncharacterized protein n=1 Tax=uncultured Caudovirales phage TaxID=2100421 RepID=A0A6J7WMD5_9CAUD|nr:hypothetical protein UFOVP226_17 [uncultured Caudovirales phage]